VSARKQSLEDLGVVIITLVYLILLGLLVVKVR
jgi:hypothetical protein